MALTKVTGQVINDTTGLVVGVTTVGGGLSATDGFFSGIVTAVGDASFSGNVSVGGTLTYEDVTNIDAVGLVTARNGIVVGSGITLSKDGDVFFTGIATGNGSGLTALNASNLASGTVPSARLGSGTASSSTFLAGDSTFKTVTGTTINNNADNRLITGSGTANTLEGESTLTYDASLLNITSTTQGLGLRLTNTGNEYTNIQFDAARTSAGAALGIINAKWNSNHEVASIYLTAGSDTSNKDDGQIKFYTSPDSGTGLQNRMSIDSSGNVTKPNNFHLLVNLSQNYTVQNASTTNTDLVKWDRVITAQSSTGASSYFNTSTHLFTAPVDGIYLFHIAVNCDFNVEGAWLVIDGSRANYTAVAPPSQNTSSVSLTHKLTASQTVGVKWYDAGNTNADFFSNDLHTWWKITLLG